LATVIAGCDVVIDFSSHTATAASPNSAPATPKPWSSEQPVTATRRNHVSRITQHVSPWCFSSNYSTGVNTLFWLTRKAAEILGPGYDLEVVEMHHRLKKDAPVAPPSHWRKS